jgi:hypothetical protein
MGQLAVPEMLHPGVNDHCSVLQSAFIGEHNDSHGIRRGLSEPATPGKWVVTDAFEANEIGMDLLSQVDLLRVHCAAMDWPIVGDAIYGTAPRQDGPGLHLHAVAVVVPLYPKRPPIRVEAPVPAHLEARLRACGWQGSSINFTEQPD